MVVGAHQGNAGHGAIHPIKQILLSRNPFRLAPELDLPVVQLGWCRLSKISVKAISYQNSTECVAFHRKRSDALSYLKQQYTISIIGHQTVRMGLSDTTTRD